MTERDSSVPDLETLEHDECGAGHVWQRWKVTLQVDARARKEGVRKKALRLIALIPHREFRLFVRQKLVRGILGA
jgi:hypothetical protein